MESEFSIRQETPLLSLEQIMKNDSKKSTCRRIGMFGMCILISGWLAAQTDTAKMPTTPSQKLRQPLLMQILAQPQVLPTMTLTLLVPMTFWPSTFGKSPKYRVRFRFVRMGKYPYL